MYEKQTWKTGDVITEEKLNHMEDGISNAGGVLIVNVNNRTLDKTWKEIHDALVSGVNVMVSYTQESGLESVDFISAIIRIGKDSNGACEIILGSAVGNSVSYVTNSENEYPAIDES